MPMWWQQRRGRLSALACEWRGRGAAIVEARTGRSAGGTFAQTTGPSFLARHAFVPPRIRLYRPLHVDLLQPRSSRRERRRVAIARGSLHQRHAGFKPPPTFARSCTVEFTGRREIPHSSPTQRYPDSPRSERATPGRHTPTAVCAVRAPPHLAGTGAHQQGSVLGRVFRSCHVGIALGGRSERVEDDLARPGPSGVANGRASLTPAAGVSFCGAK